MSENEISKVVVDAAIEVHRTRGGPGLLESVYEEALVYEIESRGLAGLNAPQAFFFASLFLCVEYVTVLAEWTTWRRRRALIARPSVHESRCWRRWKVPSLHPVYVCLTRPSS